MLPPSQYPSDIRRLTFPFCTIVQLSDWSRIVWNECQVLYRHISLFLLFVEHQLRFHQVSSQSWLLHNFLQFPESSIKQSNSLCNAIFFLFYFIYTSSTDVNKLCYRQLISYNFCVCFIDTLGSDSINYSLNIISIM